MSNASTWQQSLENDGYVSLRTSMSSLVWRVGLACLIVAGFIYTRYRNDQIGQQMMIVAFVAFAALILGCVLFVRTRYGDKEVRVDRHGITNVDGALYRWEDVSSVTEFKNPRGENSVQINLTPEAWQKHIDSQGTAGSIANKANKLIVRKNAIIVPDYLDADARELAAWLNGFAAGQPA